MNALQNRIVINPRVLVGKPVIRGTRIPVDLILRLVSQGVPLEEILDEYPRLTRHDILAAIAYAREAVRAERVYPLSLRPHAV